MHISVVLFGWSSAPSPPNPCPQGLCNFIWRPTLHFSNAVSSEVVSRNLRTIPYLQTVVYVVVMRGTFASPMNFRSFPKDSQDLIISFIDLTTEDRKRVRFGPVKAIQAALSQEAGQKDKISGVWDVDGAQRAGAERVQAGQEVGRARGCFRGQVCFS